MRSGGGLAYGVMSGFALSATLPTASQSEYSPIASPSMLVLPGNVSAATTNVSYLNDIANIDLLSLNQAPRRPSNSSTSLYDLPFGYNLPVATNGVAQCDGATFGRELDPTSCLDAWQNMGWGLQRVRWGPRGPGRSSKYILPYRWSSGKTAITYLCEVIVNIFDGYL